ncbi:MAG: hypothetical protein F6K22_33245 [Okeania sp. SIO2F4]|uniref:hypothetical protein n=1 Tax=Okeania sp. SIO2F4 TaxID=2607790 RepID=UPI001429D8A0|nr:hypothetical protein [Okeania sp. SIO2F4]NES07234.1 hypothetical protein [Okeania sp. SIO2F4]
MAIVRTGDWIEVKTTRLNSGKTKLKGKTFQVLRTNVTSGELVVDTGEIMGQVKLLNSDVSLALPPKFPAVQKTSSTLDSTLTRIKNLTNRYKESGGKIDTYFLEQILGREAHEQILSNLYISAKNSLCSEGVKEGLCSEKIDNSGAKTIGNPPKNEGSRPPGRKNTKVASGWLDKYDRTTDGRTTWYFCRDKYITKVKKTKITNTQKQAVENLIKLGY